MAVARSIALLSYRGGAAYNLSQADTEEPFPQGDERVFKHRVQTYQRYQGEKLRKRFNAYSYLRMMDAVDSHRIPVGEPIYTPTLVVAISSDLLFTPEEHQTILDRFPNHEFHVIDSPFGHDGFLVEADLLDEIIKKFMKG